MKRLKTSYKIENKLYTFDCIAKTFKGKNEVLLDKGDNLLENVSFNDKGYKVVNFKEFLSHKRIIKYVEKSQAKKIIVEGSGERSKLGVKLTSHLTNLGFDAYCRPEPIFWKNV